MISKALFEQSSKLRFVRTAKEVLCFFVWMEEWGLASQMTFRCAECDVEAAFISGSKTGRFFPINRSAVFAAIGRGYAALAKVCSTLYIPGPMAKRSYEKHSKHIKDAAVLGAKESMCVVVEEKRDINNCGEDDLADIAITIDGTWMKRGHSSLYGAVFALSCLLMPERFIC